MVIRPGQGVRTAFRRTQSEWRSVLAVLAVALATAAVAGAPDASASGNTITVNTTETAFTMGDGLCSLSEAIDYANGTPESDCSSAAPSGDTTIDLEPGTYSPGSTIELTEDANIVGPGASTTTLSGGGTNQVLSVETGVTATVSGVTITDGVSGDATSGCSGSGIDRSCPAEDGNAGGGIYNNGTLTLEDDVVSGNATSAGTAPFGLHVACFSNCPAAAGQGAGDGGAGGGIFNDNDGILTVEDSVVSGNTAGDGGNGTAGVSGTGSDASAGQPGGEGGWGGEGGGIFDQGTLLTVTDSTISGNVSGSGGTGGAGSSATDASGNGGDGGQGGFGGEGGGIISEGPTIVTGSTISGNSTGGGSSGGAAGQASGSGSAGSAGAVGLPAGGGGVEFNDGGSVTNSTFADNTAGSGGAIDAQDYPLQLAFVTIAGNSATVSGATGGLYEYDSAISEQGSVIAGNSGGNCANWGGGDITDGGGNVTFGDSSCPGTVADPKLGTLGANGGLTQTVALGAGSAAIGAVPAALCSLSMDERGVSRSQPSGCDAGAYESAPPALSEASAVATGQRSATVSGQVDPYLTDAKLTVDYGTSTAYGSAAGADGGAGNANAPFSVALSGLTPGTTYHAKVVATNTDGSTSSADLTFTTQAAPAVASSRLTASIPRNVKGTVIAVKLRCSGGATSCSGAIKLTSLVTTRGGQVLAVAAAGSSAARAKKPKRKTVVKADASARYSVAAGATKTVKVTLNAAARKLLSTRRRLPAVVAITGAAKLSGKTTFTPLAPKRKSRPK